MAMWTTVLSWHIFIVKRHVPEVHWNFNPFPVLPWEFINMFVIKVKHPIWEWASSCIFLAEQALGCHALICQRNFPRLCLSHTSRHQWILKTSKNQPTWKQRRFNRSQIMPYGKSCEHVLRVLTIVSLLNEWFSHEMIDDSKADINMEISDSVSWPLSTLNGGFHRDLDATFSLT